MLRTLNTFIVVLVLCFTSSCRHQDEATSVGTESLTAKLGGLAPEGWRLYEEVRRFIPENLYEKIDGRAEFYLAYDMIEMTFAGFEASEDDGQFIDIAVYDMGTPTHAFGVFSAERSHEGSPLDFARDGYRSGANYYLWKGQYYVQIIASDSTDELQRIGEGLARKSADLLSDSGESVWGLTALPAENRVRGSERYFLVDAMGLDFMRNTYIAQYNEDGAAVSAFLSQQETPEAAEAVVAQYIEYANRYGKDVNNLTVEGVDLTICDMDGSYDVVFRKDGLVAGVSSVEDEETALRFAVDLWRQLPTEVPQ
jgi:hypothetical protein